MLFVFNITLTGPVVIMRMIKGLHDRTEKVFGMGGCDTGTIGVAQ